MMRIKHTEQNTISLLTKILLGIKILINHLNLALSQCPISVTEEEVASSEHHITFI